MRELLEKLLSGVARAAGALKARLSAKAQQQATMDLPRGAEINAEMSKNTAELAERARVK